MVQPLLQRSLTDGPKTIAFPTPYTTAFNADHDDTTRWAKADAFVPAHELIGGGKPTFIGVTVVRATPPGARPATPRSRTSCWTLRRASGTTTLTSSPLGGALHHDNFVPFVLETGGRLRVGLETDALKSWVRPGGW